MKLWQKNTPLNPEVERFTVGRDRELDLLLAPYDIMGSMAHTRMLRSIGLIGEQEAEQIHEGLREILSQIRNEDFRIEEGVEDIHSQVELWLTRRLGEAGKKIHSGRSRNDQVLVDLKLFFRSELEGLVGDIRDLFDLQLQLSDRYSGFLLPGYTHMQLAMPSSFGLWFGAYAESLSDDLLCVRSAYDLCNKNPLGSGAGYGSSFPLDRELTTRLLGFGDLHYNVVYAQMSRGKTERVISQCLANIAATLGKQAMDICLFMNQELGFLSFPEELTTGSSIMPHKKNPDVFELIRARCNQIQGISQEIALMTVNLPSGYHRDFQLLKEILMPAFGQLRDCLRMFRFMIEQVRVREDILSDDRYLHLFSVEAVNELVLQGIPFREAYRKVGQDLAEGSFGYRSSLKHTHTGSLGNLAHAQIRSAMDHTLKSFPFEQVHKALDLLIG